MANERQLALLSRGVKSWNQWRSENPVVEIDLIEANLRYADLRNANLRNVNLRYANLSKVNLGYANLSGANFSKAKLMEANLRHANLNGADLRSADLRYANLRGADLRSADFSEAKLRRVNLSDTTLSDANLSNANLRAAQVLSANFQTAILTGACIQDWQIGSSTILEGVECDYIFRTYDAKNKQFSGRLPVDPHSTFAPGEFTRRFQIIATALETIDITFTEGIDWQAFFQSFQELRNSRPNEDISIQGMERKGDAFVVRLEVEAAADKASIETQVKQLYAEQLTALEARYAEQLRLQGVQIKEARQTIKTERREKATLMGIMTIMAENQGPRNDFRGAQFAGGFAETVRGNQVGGIINNYGQTADDIVRLLASLRTLSQTFPSEPKEEALMALDDLEADLSEPTKQEPKRIGKRLQRLMAAGAAAMAIAGGAATVSGDINEFTENVLELGEKMGLAREDIQRGAR